MTDLADEGQAEPLTEHQERVLARIAKALKTDQDVYRAAHRERVYTSKAAGELIPYTDAEHLAAAYPRPVPGMEVMPFELLA